VSQRVVQDETAVTGYLESKAAVAVLHGDGRTQWARPTPS